MNDFIIYWLMIALFIFALWWVLFGRAYNRPNLPAPTNAAQKTYAELADEQTIRTLEEGGWIKPGSMSSVKQQTSECQNCNAIYSEDEPAEDGLSLCEPCRDERPKSPDDTVTNRRMGFEHARGNGQP